MQVVIEMSDDYYEILKYEGQQPNAHVFAKLVANGIPLPKGHGDIVDIEILIDMFWDGNSMEITKYDLSVIEPIIEADRSEE